MKFISNLYTNHKIPKGLPKIVVATMLDTIWLARLEEVNKCMLEIQADSIVFWTVLHDIEFFDEDGNKKDFGDDLAVCTVRTFKRNAFQLYLPFEHLPFEMWSDAIYWERGVLEVNKSIIQNWVADPINERFE